MDFDEALQSNFLYVMRSNGTLFLKYDLPNFKYALFCLKITF